MTTLEYWSIFMDMGGRLFLTILAIDILLLLVLEINKHGNVKNRRNRSKVSKRQGKRSYEAAKGRAVSDRVEVLEADTERVPARPDKQGARLIVAKEGLFETRGDGSRGIDGITIDSIQGDSLTIRRSKNELSESAVSEEPLSPALTKVSIGEV